MNVQKGGAGGDGEGDVKNWSQRPQRVPSCQFQVNVQKGGAGGDGEGDVKNWSRDHRGFRAARSKPHQPIIKKNWHEKPQDWLPCCVIGRSCRKHHLCHVIIHVLSPVTRVCCDKTCLLSQQKYAAFVFVVTNSILW